jgi:hypothetical protein
MKLRTLTISIGISRDHTNLPVEHDSFVTERAKWALGVRMQSGLCQSCLSVLDFFGKINQFFSTLKALTDHSSSTDLSSFPCFPCVGDSSNSNLTSAQKELLLWHWKLGINMYRVQMLMRERT